MTSMAERIKYRFQDLDFPQSRRSTRNDMEGMVQMVIGPPNTAIAP